MPSLNAIRKSAKIHRLVDTKIRELEKLSEIAGSVGKINKKVEMSRF